MSQGFPVSFDKYDQVLPMIVRKKNTVYNHLLATLPKRAVQGSWKSLDPGTSPLKPDPESNGVHQKIDITIGTILRTTFLVA